MVTVLCPPPSPPQHPPVASRLSGVWVELCYRSTASLCAAESDEVRALTPNLTSHALYLHFNKSVPHELADWNAAESRDGWENSSLMVRLGAHGGERKRERSAMLWSQLPHIKMQDMLWKESRQVNFIYVCSPISQTTNWPPKIYTANNTLGWRIISP